MAVVEVTNHLYNGTQTNDKLREYQVYSTDVKPALELENAGSECIELDTGSFFTWNGTTWVEL